MKYNLNYIYWVLLITVLKLFNEVYTKKKEKKKKKEKPVFHECRALLDIIITV